MVSVVGKGESFVPELLCAVCSARCSGDRFRFAFPPVEPGKRVDGKWVCRRCADGRLDGHLETLFGTQRVLFMNGMEALRRMVVGLADPLGPALARQRPPRVQQTF
jgi:hypothetical protein